VSAQLALRGLRAWHGPVQALFGVSLGVAAGEVLALVGRNGAGKSSVLKGAIGLIRTQGEVWFDGRRIDHLPAWQRARLGLGYVPEDRRIFTDLSVRENLEIGAQGRAYDLDALLELFPNLAPMLERPAAHMSGGEQQMLAIARTLAAGPRVVLLDEPSEGIAPQIVTALAATVRALKAQGAAVLLSEQNAVFVAAVADRALLIERGEVVGAAAPAELLQPTGPVRAVLGL
jgi:branched-chain amino acid transport system ATP-binding protein